MLARHYAMDVMQAGNKKLRDGWETFSAIVEERNNMFELSVVFHDWQQKVLRFMYNVQCRYDVHVHVHYIYIYV